MLGKDKTVSYLVQPNRIKKEYQISNLLFDIVSVLLQLVDKREMNPKIFTLCMFRYSPTANIQRLQNVMLHCKKDKAERVNLCNMSFHLLL